MANQELTRLFTLIRDQRDVLLAVWRQRVRQLPGAANLDTPTINNQVPELLDNLAQALKAGDEVGETNAISAEHGLLRWQVGFDVTEVVAEYNILRQCLYEAAESENIAMVGMTTRIINGVFDDAIGKAVKAFETMMTIQLQHRHDEHWAFLMHDLRTPLEALSLATTFIDRSLPEAERDSGINSALSVLRSNIDRLASRVRHVLSTNSGIGRTFTPQFASLKLRSEVEKVVRDLELLATSAQIKVRNEIGDHLEVFSDELLLSQIIQNLLSNAVKFTAGGTIEIGARQTNDGEWVECWVKDSGRGIPADQLVRVFERFETSGEGAEKGVGLGLAIVKEIVELHKGEIRVQSEVAKGSTFTFVLPAKSFE